MLNVIKQPRVTLISRPLFIEPDHLKTNFIGESSDAEKLVEFSGRLCYMSQANLARKTTREYLDNIFQQSHGSIMENAVFVLLIEGVSRTCTHELVRHRHFGFSQLSQRYVDESQAQFIMPPAIIGNEILENEWIKQMVIAQQGYIDMVNSLMKKYEHISDKTHKRKLSREAARSILPNATETKIVLSGSLRSWRVLLELRTSEGADMEIRRLAIECLKIFQKEAPSVFSDFEIYDFENSYAARCKYHKI